LENSYYMKFVKVKTVQYDLVDYLDRRNIPLLHIVCVGNMPL